MNLVKKIDNNTKVFLALLRAGLWEENVSLSALGQIDFAEIYRLAEEQSVVGLIAAGLEHVVDINVPPKDVMPFVSETLQIEQRNKAMDSFMSRLILRMRGADIYTLLVKGQGIAQCYERPLWRASGDTDLLLSESNFIKAKSFLLPLASSYEQEIKYSQHIGMIIDKWEVELHGNLHTGILRKVDRVLDDVQNDVFCCGNVRSWMNEGTQVFLPGVNDDIIFVFAHILQHYYKGGIGLRQICDWCRLLWAFQEKYDLLLLENRLRLMGVITEWKALATLAVEYLGMPVGAMPFYSGGRQWKRKARRIIQFILNVGNMGHNRDMSYMKKPFIIRKSISAGRKIGDFINHAKVSPMNSLRVSFSIMINGIISAARGEG